MNSRLLPVGVLLAASLVTGLSAQANHIKEVLPDGFGAVEGDSYSAYPWGGATSRTMLIYSGESLGIEGRVRIRGLRFRPDGTIPTGSSNNTLFSLDLSTGSTTPATASMDYDLNHGADRVDVYDGIQSIQAHPSSLVPRTWDFQFDFGTEFEWDPTNGPLVMDFEVGNVFGSGGFQADLESTADAVVLEGMPGSSQASLSVPGAVIVELILDTQAVPQGHLNNEGASEDLAPWGEQSNGWRSLDIYDASLINLDGRRLITALSWRPNGGETFDGATYDCEIYLSTTSVDPLSMGTTFANQHGADRTLVFAGDLTMPDVTVADMPNAFDLTCHLQTPFEYNTAVGNLAVEVVVHSHDRGSPARLDAVDAASVPVGRLWASNAQIAIGSLRSEASVLGLGTEPMPTIPEAHDTAFLNGVQRSPFDRAESRTMFLYPPSEIATTEPIWIEHIAFRPSDNGADFGPATWTCTIDMSLAHPAINGPLDNVFENNHGAFRRRVFDGKVSVPLVPGGQPADSFPIDIKLDSPFLYDPWNPQARPLIVDIRVTDRNGNTRRVDSALNSNVWRISNNTDVNAPLAESNAQNGLVIRLGGSGSNALAEDYGVGCGGVNGVPDCYVRSLPQLPNEDFAVELRNAPSAWFNLLLIGASETNLPLTLAGAPGCTLLNGREYGTFLAISDPAGDASYPIPLPDDPLFYGQSLMVQWACLDDTANTLGVTFSKGLRLLLRK